MDPTVQFDRADLVESGVPDVGGLGVSATGHRPGAWARTGRSAVRSALRESRLLARRPWDLALISWVPLLAVTLLWWIFSAGLPTRLPIGVLDDDHTALSRQLERFLQATPGLTVAERFDNAAEAERALRAGRVDAAVLIPADFTRSVKQGRAAQVTLLHNAQLGTHSGLIQRDVRTVVGTLSAGIEMAARNKRGEPALAVRVAMEPIRTGMVTLFNTALDYEWFLAAALIPALLHVLAMTAGAWSVGRELRDRTLGAWLLDAGDDPDAGSAASSRMTGPPDRATVAGALCGKLVWAWLGLGLTGSLALLWITAARGWHPAGSLLWTAVGLWIMLALSLAMAAWPLVVYMSLVHRMATDESTRDAIIVLIHRYFTDDTVTAAQTQKRLAAIFHTFNINNHR